MYRALRLREDHTVPSVDSYKRESEAAREAMGLSSKVQIMARRLRETFALYLQLITYSFRDTFELKWG